MRNYLKKFADWWLSLTQIGRIPQRIRCYHRLSLPFSVTLHGTTLRRNGQGLQGKIFEVWGVDLPQMYSAKKLKTMSLKRKDIPLHSVHLSIMLPDYSLFRITGHFTPNEHSGVSKPSNSFYNACFEDLKSLIRNDNGSYVYAEIVGDELRFLIRKGEGLANA